MADAPVSLSIRHFPEHAAIVGDMLLGYGDLEFFMLDLIARAVADSDINTAARVLYRLRGANDRLNVADALLRPVMIKLKLEGQYCQWLGAMRRCRQIRNLYAHCAWDHRDGALYLTDLEEAGQTVEGAPQIEWVPVTLGLLKEQQAFFSYTLDLVFYLGRESRFLLDRRRKHRARYPKSRAAPKLHSPPDSQTR
jgi:hypothetical protein